MDLHPESFKMIAPCLQAQRSLRRIFFGLGTLECMGAKALLNHLGQHACLEKIWFASMSIGGPCMEGLAQWFRDFPALVSVKFDDVTFHGSA